jgi:hypothetical protein
MEKVGFAAVTIDREHLRFEQDLRTWFDEVRTRGTCSQLLAIPDPAYEAGLWRLKRELAAQTGPLMRENHLCILTIRGEKRDEGHLEPGVMFGTDSVPSVGA